MNNKIIIILLCWREKKAECWKFAFESAKVDIIFFIIKQKLSLVYILIMKLSNMILFSFLSLQWRLKLQ